MRWSTMSYQTLTAILEIAVRDSENIIRKCCVETEKNVRKRVAQMEREIVRLEEAEDKHEAVRTSSARELVTALYAQYRKALYRFVQMTQYPFTAELLIDEDEAEQDTLTELDEKIDGIFVFADSGMLRLRTPPLPHKKKPRIWLNGKTGIAVSTTAIYGEAVYRAMEAKSRELFELYQSLGEKCIHILNVFGGGTNTMDNDNRDTASVINSVCSFLPYGDIPDKTRIVNDGWISDRLMPGTYITVLPYEDGLADNAETENFWIGKLRVLGYTGEMYGD